MCGICGYGGFIPNEISLARMAGVVAHRGPDDEGLLVRDQVGLAMRRLSIIDVAGGRQPIFNEAGTLAIVFNGEIYNYRPLAEDLAKRGHRFSTCTDCETILHLYEEHGVDCLRFLRGMFAFAIHDAERKQLFLARDRLGIKPLYYWSQDSQLVFASEIKSILECDKVKREPVLAAIDAYLSLRYVPGPGTMLAGVNKLPPGHWLVFSEGQITKGCYWQPALSDGPFESDDYYRERFAELFEETVRLHMESDVPLGSFLSGGVDSTAIVATMSQLSHRPVKTFAVGFGSPHDELDAARAVAKHLGCDHREVVCRTEDIALLPKIVWHLDEPFGDAIVLPMFLLSQLAGTEVKVALSGEGADEMLAGYLFHKTMFWAGQYARSIPAPLQARLISPLAGALPASVLNLFFAYPARLGNRGRRKVLDYLSLAANRNPEAEYRFLVSLFDWRDKSQLYGGQMKTILADGHHGAAAENVNRRSSSAYLNDLLQLQFADWLPDDILTKADKMCMAHSVEGRVPFMDHILVEFLCKVPPHLKLRRLTDKILLRDFLSKAMSRERARVPKRAFYMPLDHYLGSRYFRDLADCCLSEHSVRRRGYFAWPAVRQLRQSLDRDFLYGKQVLSLIMLELWHRIFVDREPGWL